jgi:hypothetical protein
MLGRSGRLVAATSMIVVAATAAGAEPRPCGPRLEAYEGYVLRQVELDGPFPFAAVFRRILKSLESDLPARGEPLSISEVNDAQDRVDKRVRATPTLLELPLSITAVTVLLENCDDEARQLDLVYWVFTTRIGAPSLALGDLNDRAREDPAHIASISEDASRLSLVPALRFDESDRLVAGAHAAWVHAPSGVRIFAEGAVSERYTTAALGVAGSREVESTLLWRASFGGGYRFEEQPVRGEEVRRGVAFGWFAGLTRPLSPLDGVARYAVQFEDGFAESSLRSPGFETDTHYRALKALTGVSGVSGRNDYAVSIGTELGSTTAATPSWYRILFDGAYNVRIAPRTPLFDHRALDLNGRLVGGWLEPVGQGRAPQSARFFGGVRPRMFSEVPDWPLLTAPMIRGYPDNRFYAQLTGDVSGRERFGSLNLTSAFTAWRRPLLPKDVYTNEGFLAAIAAEKTTARSSLSSYHESRDPAMADADTIAADADGVLISLEKHLSQLHVPDASAGALASCRASVRRGRATIRQAREQRKFRTVGNPNAPPGSLLAVVKQCETNLNGSLDDPTLHAAAVRLRQHVDAIERVFTKVDHAAVERKAKEDFALADRALDAFVHEINLVSVDPVAIFDVAYASPAVRDTFVRYSVGGGVRLTVGSMVSFSLGYAVNPNRGRGEPAGALFFEMRFADVLR